MKHKLIFPALLTLIILAASSFVNSRSFISKKHSGGVLNTTGSPGENNCGTICHGGGSGITTVSIISNPAFIANQYISGQTYTIDIVVSNSGFSLFGFDAEILNSTNANAGNITTAMAGVQLFTSGGKKNATHTTPKGGVGTATFSFVWVAPVSGNATIYAAGNAVNGNASSTGDKPGVTSLALTMNNPAYVTHESRSVIGFNVFPNPVSSEIKLNYSLVNSGIVKIALFDLQGKEVMELLNETQNEGYHSIQVPLAGSVSCGVYFVKMNLGEKTNLQRLLVVQ